MLYKDRIKNLVAVYPHLSRVWIKTGDTRTPLKGVWMDKSRAQQPATEGAACQMDLETSDVSEDHLLAAAPFAPVAVSC